MYSLPKNAQLILECVEPSDWWLQLDLPSKLVSDQRDTIDLGKRLANFNGGKTQLVSFDRSNNSGAINMKMPGSVVEEKA